MRISIMRDDLFNAIKIVYKASFTRTALPVLECINIEVDKGIILTASCLDIEIRAKAEGEIIEPGNISVNTALLHNLIAKLPNEELLIETLAYEAVITCNKKEYKLPIVKDDFPLIRNFSQTGELKVENLKDIITQTVYAADPSDQNPMMTVLRMETNGRMAGLNAHRIAIKKFNGNRDAKLNIPANHLKILSSIMDEDVMISYNNNFVRFTSASFILTSRMIEGTFFNIDQMLPKDYKTEIKVNKDKFICALETLSLFIKDTDRRPVVFDIKEDMNMQVNTVIGSGNEKIEIEKEGEDLQIGFNPKFLLEALKVVPDDEVVMQFNGKTYPANIVGSDYIHMILPVRFDNG